MGIELYTLRKRGVIVLHPGGGKETAYFLQLVLPNPLSPDAHHLVDSAIRGAHREWQSAREFPARVVKLQGDGIPQPGTPILKWGPERRVYCFGDEPLEPVGYLGERALGGFFLRTVQEQARLDDLETARSIDQGKINVYRDFWAGKTFRSGQEFLAYRRETFGHSGGSANPHGGSPDLLSPKLLKILHLIRLIEFKGRKASPADIQYLNLLKSKALQLGYSFQ